MGIDFGFGCRECGEDVSVHYDTSDSGPVELRQVRPHFR